MELVLHTAWATDPTQCIGSDPRSEKIALPKVKHRLELREQRRLGQQLILG
jgi:hypothetical protein